MIPVVTDQLSPGQRDALEVLVAVGDWVCGGKRSSTLPRPRVSTTAAMALVREGYAEARLRDDYRPSIYDFRVTDAGRALLP